MWSSLRSIWLRAGVLRRRGRKAILTQRRAAFVDAVSVAVLGTIPRKHIIRDPVRELEMLQGASDSRIELHDGSPVDYSPFMRVDSRGLTLVSDRGYPRASFIYTLNEVSVETRYGIPWNRDRNLLLSAHCGELEREALEPWAKRFVEYPRYADLILVPSTPTYFHWLIEQMPGVLIAKQHHPQAHFLISNDAPAWMLPACEAMGLQAHRAPRTAVYADRYTTVTRQRMTPLPVELSILRESLPARLGPDWPRHIWISRGNSSKRFVNEADVEAMLHAKGFVTVMPETLDLQQQAEVFANAEVVVATSGSALSNIVWMSPGTRLVVLSVRSDFFLWNRLNPGVETYQIDAVSLSLKEVLDTVADLAGTSAPP